MSDPSLPGEEIRDGDAPVTPIGMQLRAAREAQGLDLERVSHRLNISSRYIAALEDDASERLPGAAFARGYLRSYARLLGLDSDLLVAEFNRQQGEVVERPVVTINKVGRQASLADPLVRGGALLLLLALVGFSVWWWQAQTTPAFSVVTPAVSPVVVTDSDKVDVPSIPSATAEAPPVPESEPEELSVTDGDEPEPESLTDEEIARLAAALEREPDARRADTDADGGTDIAGAAEAAIAEEQGAALQGRLVVRFVDECWVTLKDAAGESRVERIFRAGDVLELEVATPAKLLIGKVSAVESAEFNGKPLAIAARARQDIARLTLSIP